MVSMRVRLSLRVPKPSPKIRHDWKAFANDPGLQTRYTEEVRNRFQQLDKGAEPSSEYMRFVAANEEATRMCVPVLDRARTSLREKGPAAGLGVPVMTQKRPSGVPVMTQKRPSGVPVAFHRSIKKR